MQFHTLHGKFSRQEEKSFEQPGPDVYMFMKVWGEY